jgi:putative ABC transport system permease protein
MLLVVVVNFINLSTARSMHRAKEVGIRKVAGASRFQLIRQFLGESLILSFVALPLAVIIYEICHPILSAYVGSFALDTTSAKVSLSILNYPFLLGYMVMAALLSGLFSGLYPAFYLASFQPVRILKGNVQIGRRKRRGSKLMIVFQFSLAVIFMVAAGVLKDQTNHLIKADMGFNKDRVATIVVGDEAGERLEVLKSEIGRHSEAVSVSAIGNMPVVWDSPQPARLPGQSEEEALTVEAYGVDYDILKTLEIELLRGRSFSRERGDKNSFVINKCAAEKLDWENPIGKVLTVGEREGTVIGVAENFLFEDIGFSIPPAVLFLDPGHLPVLLVKYRTAEGYPDLAAHIEESWKKVMPDYPLVSSTLEELFDGFFGLVGRISDFIGAVGLAAVIFSCLGLLGLASFVMERRTKEIGIRKIMGASVPRVTWTVIREFVFLVLISNALAVVLIHIGWNKVLQMGLLFLTDISVFVYISAVLLSVSCAFMAVVFQTLKTSRRNPVETLRFE